MHELLEYHLIRNGASHDYMPLPGGRPGQQWTPAHDITNAVLGVKDVYTPEAMRARDRQSAGARDQ